MRTTVSSPPIHERHTADVERIEDVVLLLAAEEDASYETIQRGLEALDFELFPVDADVNVDEAVSYDEKQWERRQPFNALDFFGVVGYVEDFHLPVDETAPIELTSEGHRAVEALRTGLEPEQYLAIQEVV